MITPPGTFLKNCLFNPILRERGDGLSKDFENQRVAEAQAITSDRRAFCNPLNSKNSSSRDRLQAICGLTLFIHIHDNPKSGVLPSNGHL